MATGKNKEKLEYEPDFERIDSSDDDNEKITTLWIEKFVCLFLEQRRKINIKRDNLYWNISTTTATKKILETKKKYYNKSIKKRK